MCILLRQMAQIFAIPNEMGSIATATVLDTANGDVLICNDNAFLYATRLIRGGSNVIFQKFNLPLVAKVVPIIKNYFFVVFNNMKLIAFEVSFSEEGKIMLKYVYNKEKPIASYFLREVVENMAELQVFYPENEVAISQFTVNGKVGSMFYALTPQNKLKISERQQLYGSKTFMALHRKSLFYFTNFSNKFVTMHQLHKLEVEMMKQLNAVALGYICLPKTEQFFLVLSNFIVVNCMDSTQKHTILCNSSHLKDLQKLCAESNDYKQTSFKITTYFDLFMLEDIKRQATYIMQIKQQESELIAVEYGKYNWFWTSSRKLVGLSLERSNFKIIDGLSLLPRKELPLIETEKRQDPLLEAMPVPEKKSLNRWTNLSSDEDEENDEGEESEKISVKQDASEDKVQSEKKIETQEKKSPSKDLVPPEIPFFKPLMNFKPITIIQKSKVSVSKSLNKSKQTEPIGRESDSIPNDIPQQAKEQQPQVIKKVQTLLTQKIESQPAKQQSQSQECIPDKIEQSPEKIEKELEKKEEQSAVVDEKSEPQQQQKEQSIQASPVKVQKVAREEDSVESADKDSEISSPKTSKEDINEPSSQKIETEEKSPQLKEEPEQKQQPKPKEENQLPKSHALLLGKLNFSDGHPLNFFNSSINRNKIFSSLHRDDNLEEASQMRRHHSQNQYYNPLLSQPPVQSEKSTQKPVVINEEALRLERERIENEKQHKLEMNQRVVDEIKKLFEETNTKLLRTLEQMGNSLTIQPYIKDKLAEELQRRVMETIKSSLTGDFQSRIQRFFVEIFRQSNEVQEETSKFYKQAALHRSKGIEIQLSNQDKILKEIKDIENMIRFSILNLKNESREIFENLVRDWNANLKETNVMVDNLSTIRDRLEAQQTKRTERYEQTKKSLEMIKNLLIDRVNHQQARKQQKLERQAAKLKEQQERRERKVKERRRRQTQKTKKSKTKKGAH